MRVRFTITITIIAIAVTIASGRSGAALAQSDARARRPSILLIIPDQLRGQALGCMGDPNVRTPNIDRLAAEGLLFRNTFANTPVCSPARAIILTGKYAHKNGMMANDLRLRPAEATLAELLGAQGYRTGFIGKWHLDGGPRLPGFVPLGPRRQGFGYWAANECSHTHFRPTYFRDTDTPITDERFEPEVWTDRAIEFVRAAGSTPFFLVVAMGPPHDPYAAPDRFMRLYDPAKLSMRPNWVTGTPGGGRAEIAGYYAEISAVDEQVGRLLKALGELGQERDTIVVVTSDHGDMLGSHGQRLKRKPWEESIRVPGIVRYPARVKPGGTTETLLTHVDLAPTLLSLCGVPVPDDMQGNNLAKVVLGESEDGADSAYFQIFVPFAGDATPQAWRGVRTHRAMYARTEAGPWVLYDLRADPFERRNLVDDRSQAALRKAMEHRLAAWMERTGDSWSFNHSAAVEDQGRLYRFQAFTTIEEYLDWAKTHPELAPRD